VTSIWVAYFEPQALSTNSASPTGSLADGRRSFGGAGALLQAKGLHVASVQNPLTPFQDDVTLTKRVVAMQDGPVVLVDHSYGCALITEAGNDPKVAWSQSLETR
jgi:hypothetical protein